MRKISKTGLVITIATAVIIFNTACKKYLLATSDKKLVVISNLKDLQSLLDDYYKINYREPYSQEESADDYYLSQSNWESRNEFDRNKYIWASTFVIPPYSQNQGNEWSEAYDRIYIANTVLDNIDKIQVDDTQKVEQAYIKGQALFLRGKTFLQLAGIWCLAFDSISAEKDMGLPLRLNSDFNTLSKRSSLKETYDRIISDLKMSVRLLPNKAIHPLRPSRPAAFGYLARAFLSSRNYKNALLYADSCLQHHSNLLDFNEVTPSSPFPIGIGRFNEEVVYESKISISSMLYRGRITESFYEQYDSSDLRKAIFFRRSASNGTIIFMGSYEQDYDLFAGIATDEMLLTRSECYARQGMIDKAMADLNYLLVKRWLSGAFIPLSASSQDEALNIILQERRKELIMRGLRWMDIKRLNKENGNIILSRNLDIGVFTLAPNDFRYALAIPEDVIELSGILQNPR